MLRLKEIREANSRTQAEVAEYLQIGRASYANIENGKRDPDTQTLYQLSCFFDVSIDEIFGLARSQIPSSPAVSLSEEEEQLLRAFRALNRENKKAILTAIKSMAGNPASQEDTSKTETA